MYISEKFKTVRYYSITIRQYLPTLYLFNNVIYINGNIYSYRDGIKYQIT